MPLAAEALVFLAPAQMVPELPRAFGPPKAVSASALAAGRLREARQHQAAALLEAEALAFPAPAVLGPGQPKACLLEPDPRAFPEPASSP